MRRPRTTQSQCGLLKEDPSHRRARGGQRIAVRFFNLQLSDACSRDATSPAMFSSNAITLSKIAFRRVESCSPGVPGRSEGQAISGWLFHMLLWTLMIAFAPLSFEFIY